MEQTASYYPALSRLIGCCLFFFIAISAHAQTRGTLEIIKDPRIDTLAARRLEAVKGSGGSTGGAYIATQGYRVQIFNGSSRNDAYAAQAKLQAHYPDIRTYISYREPDFKVHAGDFRTRMEATKLLQELRPMFPVMFIIREKINPPVQ
ncbi:SPOR domain-containing protein [Mucilaginibacter boryungensis]|uniref:SPOR domain-containing protein n=1 Tax=Mucilaginibacter boryungensis TaxID=768480 RepID=A0ABR9XKT9_9SPHI|nr:SPOR domain-containing protein [Mucilaginibacter boryungensis]MBE9667830.1 SPOR domain-containing protein [Mucilaginibacter boryungensis]